MSFIYKHKYISILFINLAIFVFAFLVLELGVRIFYPKFVPLGNETRQFWQYDSLLGWSHIPNSYGNQIVQGGKKINIAINSKGLRDVEYDYKRNSKKRILVLGDSYAWGFGVPDNYRMSELIENNFDSLEVINAAVAGYSTDQQLLYYLSEGYKYNADILLLLFFENDFLGNTLSQIHWYNKPCYQLMNDELILRNVPVPPLSFYQEFRRFISGKSYFLSFVLKRLSIFNAQSYSIDNFNFSASAKITALLFHEFGEIAKRNGTKILLVSVPMDSSKVSFLVELSNMKNFQFLDLTSNFTGAYEFTIPDDGHWNKKGNKIAAKAIINYLLNLRY